MANAPGAGFEVETNEVTLLTADTTERLPLMSKRDVAERLLDAAERLL
jgi:phosphopantothenoylcysteine synthetase/decarboxylase